MQDTSLRSESDSTDSSIPVQTPPSGSYSHVLLSSSPRVRSPKRHINDIEPASDLASACIPIEFPPPSSTPSSPSSESCGEPTTKKHIIAGHRNMRRSFISPQYDSSLWSPELRFAMRAVGNASNPILTTQDIAKGRNLIQTGISQLPDEAFKKAYIVKHASRDCILSRLSTTLREVDLLEKMKDFLSEMHRADKSQLASIDEELKHFKDEAVDRHCILDEDVAYRHAIYANELTALTSANAQLSLMSTFLPSDMESDPSLDSDSSSEAEAEVETKEAEKAEKAEE